MNCFYGTHTVLVNRFVIRLLAMILVALAGMSNCPVEAQTPQTAGVASSDIEDAKSNRPSICVYLQGLTGVTQYIDPPAILEQLDQQPESRSDLDYSYREPENPAWSTDNNATALRVGITAYRHSLFVTSYKASLHSNSSMGTSDRFRTVGGIELWKASADWISIEYRYTIGFNYQEGTFSTPVYIGSDWNYDYYREGTGNQSSVTFWYGILRVFRQNIKGEYTADDGTFPKTFYPIAMQFQGVELGIGESYFATWIAGFGLTAGAEVALLGGYSSAFKDPYYRVALDLNIGLNPEPISLLVGLLAGESVENEMNKFALRVFWGFTAGNFRDKSFDEVESHHGVMFTYLGLTGR